MSEKVIYEIRFIETEDGVRIEMKGDKERLHKLNFERRKRHHEERHEWREWMRWERRFRRPWCFGPWSWWGDEPESEEKPTSASPEDKGAPASAV